MWLTKTNTLQSMVHSGSQVWISVCSAHKHKWQCACPTRKTHKSSLYYFHASHSPGHSTNLRCTKVEFGPQHFSQWQYHAACFMCTRPNYNDIYLSIWQHECKCFCNNKHVILTNYDVSMKIRPHPFNNNTQGQS